MLISVSSALASLTYIVEFTDLYRAFERENTRLRLQRCSQLLLFAVLCTHGVLLPLIVIVWHFHAGLKQQGTRTFCLQDDQFNIKLLICCVNQMVLWFLQTVKAWTILGEDVAFFS